jgi:Na+-driven multidrug efflux pump
VNTKVFEEPSIPKAVITLAIPAIATNLITIIYNMADTFFVGQTGDPNQVAAVSLAMPIFFLFMAFGNMFGIGGSSLISRLLGEGNLKKTKAVSSFCFYGCILFGVILMPLVLVFLPNILSVIGCSKNTIEFAKNYLTYIVFGGVFIILSWRLLCLYQSTRNGATPPPVQRRRWTARRTARRGAGNRGRLKALLTG